MQKISEGAENNMEKIDTIIFDMDGVLVNESKSYRYAIKLTAEYFLENEEEITLDMIEEYKERGGLNNDWECTKAILKDRGMDIDIKRIRGVFDDFYFNETYKAEELLITIDTLKKLKERFRLAIFTGRPKRDADLAIDNFDIREFFDMCVTFDDVKNQKPDPEGLLKCMEELKSKGIVYLGDTIDDMKAAVSAGVIGIGVMPPTYSKKIRGLLKDNGAKAVLDNVNQLLDLLESGEGLS